MILGFVVGVTLSDGWAQQHDPYKAFEAKNKIVINYAVFLPDEFDKSQEYPAILAFPSGEMGRKDADDMVERMWSTPANREGWIIVVPLQPGDDWRSHPKHHALNDLLDHVNDQFPVQGDKFHIMGYGQLGSDIASTWSGMSREYFYSLTTASGSPYRRWDDGDLRRIPTEEGKRLDVLMIYGAEDVEAFKEVEAAKGRLGRIGHHFFEKRIEGSNATLQSLSDGRLLKLMASTLLQH